MYLNAEEGKVMAKFDAPSQQLLAVPKKTTMNGGQDSRCSDREPSECGSEALLLEKSLPVTMEAFSDSG